MQQAEKQKEYKEMWNDFVATVRDSLDELKHMPHVLRVESRSYPLC